MESRPEQVEDDPLGLRGGSRVAARQALRERELSLQAVAVQPLSSSGGNGPLAVVELRSRWASAGTRLPAPVRLGAKVRLGKRGAVAACLLVALIWGSSLVITKGALAQVDPLTLAGLRYSLGALLLIPFVRPQHTRSLSASAWLCLGGIGLAAFGLGNTAIFAALVFLPAASASLALGLLPAVVLVAGWVWLGERARPTQMFGLGAAMVGLLVIFSDGLAGGPWLAVSLLAVGVAGNALRSVLGRWMMTAEGVDPLPLTVYPLAVGGAVTLAIAVGLNGLPSLTLSAWGTIVWLAAVNTAAAYGLFNYALRELPAYEVNLLLNLTPFVTAVLGWAALGESLTWHQGIGLAGGVAGTICVQASSTDRKEARSTNAADRDSSSPAAMAGSAAAEAGPRSGDQPRMSEGHKGGNQGNTKGFFEALCPGVIRSSSHQPDEARSPGPVPSLSKG